jgi:amino acid adenylation domain-containing protein
MPSPYSEARRNLLEKCLHGQLSLRPETESIPRRDPKEPVPLSYSQEQVWFHAQLVPDIPLYNEPVTIHYSGDLDIPALEQSFNEILHRHEAWRTGFTVVDGKPVQDVRPELSISLPVVDLRHLPEERRDSTAVRIATEEARKPLDLTQVPLFRARLIRMGDRQYRLYLVLSHIIFDGVAIYRIFLPELAALYQARVAGRPSPLPELDIQYPDYSCWQRKSLPPDSLAEHISYWRRQLGNDLPVLNLPSDYPRPPVQTFRGSMYPFTLSPSLTDAVKSLSRKEGVTLFQTLLAGFAALLCRYSGQDDLPIGSVTAGRDRPETKPLLGYFLNTVVLRADLSDDPGFRELLCRMRNLTLETLDHDCVPFGRLIHELNAPRDLSRNPLFQVMFSLEPSLPDLDPAWHLTQMDVDTEATKYDLYLELDERRDAILARFHYSTDLFNRTTIVRMSEHWMRLLEGAARDPSLRVSQLPLLSEQERSQIVVEWNQTRSEYAQGGGIHDLFNAQCERTPDNTAVHEGERRLSFRQLQERSNRLAHYLRKLGANSRTRVALCVDRSFDMFVGLLGILKTGAAYVPLDPSHPPDRVASLLEDAEPAVLITQQKLLANAPVHRIPAVILDADWHKIARASADFPANDVQSDEPAYVLYTSGSSGKPKGVEGTHRGAMNRMSWMWERYPFEAGEVCCQKTNLGFVDSIWEIFGPLLAGIPSVILPAEVVRDPEELLRSLAGEGVTRIVLVPSLLRALLDHAPNLQERVPRLKLWSCSGEALSGELARRFRQGHPEATLLNIYGASEVAADVTWHEVGAEDVGATVPIGKPISNTQMYVLDPQRNPVPVGVRGEIYVGGDGLALGYWNRAALTAERFVENPIAPERSKRLYRTGDLGRWRGDGEIEYLGRVDGEVKLRGMRIDLGEIESVLASHAGLREAAVERVEEGGEATLVAYLVPEDGEKADGRELRRYLRSKLPEHMVPARFVQVAELPLLPSGKVNRRALATVEGVVLSERGTVAPRTAVEQKLAGMWREVLKVGDVGVDQNFFELGGHSLLVLQVMVRIRREFDVELGVRTMFEEPTIAELASEVEKARATGMKAQTPVLERRARPRTAGTATREALLAQLDTLSADDVQTLLKHVLDAKQLQ